MIAPRKMAIKNSVVQKRPADERIGDFNEISLGYTKAQAIREASRCIHCPHSPCSKKCPLGINVEGFIKKMAEGDLQSAYKEIIHYNPMPAITGRVCPQEHNCGAICSLKKTGKPINVGGLEAFVADWALKNHIQIQFKASENQKMVAVIGSGPSGMSCALELRKKGYQVHIYEALPLAGGILQFGIPGFRLPKNILDKHVAHLEKMGIKFMLSNRINQDVQFRDLKSSYDAVFIGIGTHYPVSLNIEGESLKSCYSASKFLAKVNFHISNQKEGIVSKGDRVGVIGAGNVAVDAARAARRLGAEVFIIYRRTQDQSTARKEELHNAIEEGIKFIELAMPKNILGDGGMVRGIELVKTRLTNKGEDGRPNPEVIPGSNFTMELDFVIVALGSKPDKSFFTNLSRINTTSDGVIKVDKNFKTSLDGVYAGGDAVGGQRTVTHAMAEGKKAAESIHKYLSEKTTV